MNKLTAEKRVMVIRCLVEGNSIRSTVRMTCVSKKTVTKLLVDLGAICADYQDRTMRNLKLARLQCDEIWSFVGCKDKNVQDEIRGQYGRGDVWTWTAPPTVQCYILYAKGCRDTRTRAASTARYAISIPFRKFLRKKPCPSFI